MYYISFMTASTYSYIPAKVLQEAVFIFIPHPIMLQKIHDSGISVPHMTRKIYGVITKNKDIIEKIRSNIWH